MPDDFSANVDTLGRLTLNTWADGSGDEVSDQDWFAIELTAGVQYRIDAVGVESGQGTLRDPHLGGIFDATGTEIVGQNFSGGLGREARLWFTPDASGTYFISAGLAPGNGTLGTYQVRVADEAGWDDVPGDATSPVRLDAGGVFEGQIDESNDIDWIGVDAVPGLVYRFAVQGSTGIPTGQLDPRIAGIFAADGSQLGPGNSGSARDAQGYAFVDTAQTIFVAAASEGAVRDGFYQVRYDTEGFIRVGLNQEGFATINETGDLDFFQVQLSAGQIYRIDAQGITADDPHIGGVWDPAGNLIGGTENYSGGLGRDARLWFTPQTDGLYTVAAGAASGVRGDIGERYVLTVTDDWDQVGTTAATAGTAELGAPYAGSIDESTDVDWIGVAMQAGVTYRVTLAGGQSTLGDTLLDTRIGGVFDETGAQLLPGTSGSGNAATALFEAPATGTFYVAAASEGVARTGLFEMTVTAETNTRLAVGQTAGGTIDAAGDQDLFTLSLTGGTQYRIDATGIGDSHIGGIYGPDGSFIDGTTNFSGGIGRDARLWFTPDTDGLYTLSVGVAPGAAGDIGGRYQVIVDDDWDDSAEDPAGAAAIELGSSYDGVIDDDFDVDWIGVLLDAGTLYRATAEGGDSTRSVGGRILPLNTQIEGIYDVNGNRVAETASGDDRTASQIYLPTVTGTYYVAVAAEGEADNGNYRLDVAPAAEATLTLGQPVSTYIFESGGQRWYEVELTEGTRYRVDATSGRDAHIAQIIGPDGQVVAGSENFSGGIGRDARLFFTPSEDGTYYVSAGENPNIADGGRRSYVVEVDDQYDDFAEDAGTTGTVVANGAALTGALDDVGDVDWIAVELTEGGAYQVVLTGGDSTLSDADGAILPVDPAFLGLFAADGTRLIGPEDGTGTGVNVAFEAPETGTFHVAVAGQTPDVTGRYSVQMWQDVVPGGPTSEVDLSLGNTNGRFEGAGDQDWYRVTLTEGQAFGFAADAAGTAPAQILGLYDATGAVVPDSGPGAVLRGTADASGTYYLAIGAADPAATGTYRVFNLGNDDFSNSAALPGAVAVGGFATGVVNTSNERDWFAVDLEAGRNYRVDVEGSQTGGGTIGDSYFYGLYRADGGFLGFRNDDSGYSVNSRADISVAEDGTYYLEVGGFSSRTGSYTLTVTDLEDDFPGDATTTGMVSTIAQANGYIGSRSGFNDRDWIAIQTELGETYRVTLAADPELQGLLYPNLGVRTEAGILSDGGSFSVERPVSLTFTAAADEAYFAEVSNRSTGFFDGQGGHYVLTLEQLLTISGTDQGDWLTLPETGSEGLVGIRGGDGIDMMSFSGLSAAVNVNLATGAVSGGSPFFSLTMDSIENATGTGLSDTFRGSDSSEKMRGLGGRDLFYGSAGERDTIDGGSSNDTISYIDSEEGVAVSLLRGRGNGGDAEGDRISNIENVIGSRHDDIIWGDGLANRIEGGLGDDILIGNGGNDYISAGLGTDIVVYSGNQAEYRITRDGIRTDVEHLDGGADGTDVIGHAEILRFADGDLIL